jgi:hypothetical protein
MSATLIGTEIFDPNQKFVYVYDFIKNWTFQVELINVSKEENPRLEYPAMVRVEGIGPSQYGTKGLIGDNWPKLKRSTTLAECGGFGEEGEPVERMTKR